MVSECKSCRTHLGEEHPQLGENCIECFANSWGELVEKSPMVSLRVLCTINELDKS